MGIPDHLTCLLRNLYAGQKATVRTGHETTDWFQIRKGIPWGCILSLCLFSLYAEYIMRNAGLDEAQAGIKIAIWTHEVKSLSRVRLFAIPWIAAHQASLSITISQSLLKLMSIMSMMPSNHLILCHPLLLLPQSLPASESFPMSQLFAWGGQSTGLSALASVLLKNTHGWSPSEWTGCISL